MRRRSKLTVVSPDAGGVERARAFAKRLNAPLAIIDKRREEVNVAEVMHIIGDVGGQHCLMVDDLIDTAGTLVKGAEALLEGRAERLGLCNSRGAFRSGGQRIEEFGNQEVVVTNSIPPSGRKPGVASGFRFYRWRLCWPARSRVSTKTAR